MDMSKKMIAVALVLCMALSCATALADTVKHERVYAVTNADGTVVSLTDSIHEIDNAIAQINEKSRSVADEAQTVSASTEEETASMHEIAVASRKACFGLTFTDLMLYCTKNLTCKSFLKVDFLGNWRSAVLRRIFCAGRSVSSAALLGVMQGRDTKLGAKETSKTALRKFPRKSIDKFQKIDFTTAQNMV